MVVILELVVAGADGDSAPPVGLPWGEGLIGGNSREEEEKEAAIGTCFLADKCGVCVCQSRS